MVESERDHMDSKRVGGWAWRKELEGSSISVRLRRLNLESFHSKAALGRVLLVGDKSAQTVMRRLVTNMAIAAAKVCQDFSQYQASAEAQSMPPFSTHGNDLWKPS
jgi:hypothetical protein